ncbi:MAG: sugar ABC transporter ATP-binding protein [Spirochaetales bacterium]|nr:sugar ABC transporter ATP-binding protein [Spirochaetales bacterium]
MARPSPLIEVRNIGKSFGATRALEDVSVEFFPGEILAMVGANGAGKSTLIKIICGYHVDFDGELVIEGRPIRLATPKDAHDNGIATVHQIINQGVVQSMSVYENLTLAELLAPGQSPFYDRDALRSRAREVALLMGLDVDLEAAVEDLSQSDRQLIAIARALAGNPKLLILDEPTSSLSEKEAERLFEMLERLKETGVSILYVSHRLHEIGRIADRVVVLRDGTTAGTLVRPFDVKEMVTRMVGEIPKHQHIVRDGDRDEGEVKIALRDLVVGEGAPPVNLRIHRGEILGITGLIGAGKSELAHVLFGIRPPISGDILIDGRRIAPASVADAVARGIFYIPEDRSNNAVVPMFTVRQNMTLPFLSVFDWLGIMKIGTERRRARAMIDAMGIKCAGEEAEMDSLSGGNQQKVVVARWLLESFELVILDEPFQGVDIRSRHEIGNHLREHIGDKAAIVIATDLDEVIEVADRVVVMNGGAIVGEQLYQHIDRDQLLHWVSMETVHGEREALEV